LKPGIVTTIIINEFPLRGLDGAGGDSNAANGPSSRFATRLTIKFDFSWHHGDRRGHARVKSYRILSKIIPVPKTKITRDVRARWIDYHS